MVKYEWPTWISDCSETKRSLLTLVVPTPPADGHEASRKCVRRPSVHFGQSEPCSLQRVNLAELQCSPAQLRSRLKWKQGRMAAVRRVMYDLRWDVSTAPSPYGGLQPTRPGLNWIGKQLFFFLLAAQRRWEPRIASGQCWICGNKPERYLLIVPDSEHYGSGYTNSLK